MVTLCRMLGIACRFYYYVLTFVRKGTRPLLVHAVHLSYTVMRYMYFVITYTNTVHGTYNCVVHRGW